MSDNTEVQFTEAVVRKVGSQYFIFSKKGKKIGGPFKTKKLANKRLKQIEFFKSKSGLNNMTKEKHVGIASLKIENVQLLSPEEVDNDKLAKAGIKRNKDLLYVRFVLCHEGVNANKDEFIFDELEQNFDTALFKPVNWEHRKQQIVGCIYDSRFVSEPHDTEAKDFKPHIICDAVVYQYQFPVQSQIMRERHSRGELSFSMETWFESAECSVCQGNFMKQDEYCDHLKNRTGASSTTSRKLKNITFAGAGVVKNPADKDAVGLTVAAKTLRDETIDFIVQDIGNFDDMMAVMDGFIQKVESDDLVDKDKLKDRIKNMFSKFISINDMNNMNDSKGGSIVSDTKIYTAEEVKAEIKAAIEDFKSKLTEEGKLSASKEELEAKSQEVEDAKNDLKDTQEELEKVKAEFKEFKEGLEKDKNAETRMSELKEVGVEFSESRQESVRKTVREMSDEAFADYRDSLKDIVANSAKSDDEKDDVDADIKTDDNTDTTKEKKRKNLSDASYEMPNLASADTQDRIGKLSTILKKQFSTELKQQVAATN